MKKRIIIGLCFCIVSVQARKKDTKELLGNNSPSITLESISPQSKSFNFKKEIEPSRPQMVKAKKQFSKNDLKIIKDELKTITYRKDAASLTDKELKKVLDLCLQLGWYEKALFYVDKLLARLKDSVLIKNYKLVRADILFEQGSLKSALEAYGEFLSLYPGSNHAEYAHYKKTLCAFYQTLSSDRDQGPTRDTIKLAESYLEKGDAYKKYSQDIKEIKSHCLALLYENETHVFEFYLKKRSFKAADKRLAFMKKEFNSVIPESQAHVLQLECRLAYAQGDTARYESRLALLEKRFPHYLNTTSRVVAHADKKTDYVSKF
ncbi:outer membrane protein assembly factor BamD [Candidatus Babeliales bacterium]|nr:outer membrane protein assembly factor BamD [Candidatus Babeliales bacterium]